MALDLQDAAVAVTYVDNGGKALDYALRRPPFETARRPHLVLLDYDLPIVPGVEVLEGVRAYDELRTAPVVVVVRNATDVEIDRCLRLGANSVVERPVSLEALANVYRDILLYWTRTHVRAPWIDSP